MNEISAQEVNALQDKRIIDVREPKEVAEGKIKDSLNIPLGLLEFRIHELDKAKEYIIVCRSGGRSGRAAQYLENQGFKVKNMTGGMLEWQGNTITE
ncbi:rhodanese-like domain-containing protein [Alkalihalobacillus pseudalcaliphilus]|uniref:rhodanese-like domain-containing protein n=1 Tax=Alkalihalobacillus pseudalcaliphilus TaxID=79884 RepID=UPI00064DB40C|nr:rhodanese-like domain-containing protein [Alkalihalobacillus pseudalcaliphilus]KMK76303.1 rhodanese domain protein [Alkalihalobacillus pseudalcaliphilus]